jgi:hypothetical protein
MTPEIRAELTRLEAGFYDWQMPEDERLRMIGAYFSLLKESGAPVEVKIKNGVWKTRVRPGFDTWWAQTFPGVPEFKLWEIPREWLTDPKRLADLEDDEDDEDE